MLQMLKLVTQASLLNIQTSVTSHSQLIVKYCHVYCEFFLSLSISFITIQGTILSYVEMQNLLTGLRYLSFLTWLTVCAVPFTQNILCVSVLLDSPPNCGTSFTKHSFLTLDLDYISPKHPLKSCLVLAFITPLTYLSPVLNCILINSSVWFIQ